MSLTLEDPHTCHSSLGRRQYWPPGPRVLDPGNGASGPHLTNAHTVQQLRDRGRQPGTRPHGVAAPIRWPPWSGGLAHPHWREEGRDRQRRHGRVASRADVGQSSTPQENLTLRVSKNESLTGA